MLVRQSIYDAMERRAVQAERNSARYEFAFFQLRNKWDALVTRINAKGGEEFLTQDQTQSQFSEAELTKLIMLCHPDKHGGKPMATELTQKLLQLKKDL